MLAFKALYIAGPRNLLNHQNFYLLFEPWSIAFLILQMAFWVKGWNWGFFSSHENHRLCGWHFKSFIILIFCLSMIRAYFLGSMLWDHIKKVWFHRRRRINICRRYFLSFFRKVFWIIWLVMHRRIRYDVIFILGNSQ